MRTYILLKLLLILLIFSPGLAQEAVVSDIKTFADIENPAFPYAKPEEVGMSTEKLNKLSDEITSWVANGEIVGAELLIIKDDKAVFHEAYGWRDREEKRPMERNSIFSIKSMSKPFTATAILMLLESGKLSLDDPVKKYISNFPHENITIHHLLSQTSGYDAINESLHGDPADFSSLAEWVDHLMQDSLAAPPGTYRYTDYNYVFLGRIVEVITGTTIEEFIDEKILQPLEMNNTHTNFSPDKEWAERVNNRYEYIEEQQEYKKYWTNKQAQPWPFYPVAYGLFTTTFDYAKFISLWMNKGTFLNADLLSEKTVEKALHMHAEGQFSGYGYGWFIREGKVSDNMPPIFFHGGLDGTLAMAIPEENAVILYFTHSRYHALRDELSALLGWLEIFDHSGPYSWRMISVDEPDTYRLRLSSEEMEMYTGIFEGKNPNVQDSSFNTFQIWQEDGHLVFSLYNQNKGYFEDFHLVPLGGNEFILGRYRAGQLEEVNPISKINFIATDNEINGFNVIINDKIIFSAKRKPSVDKYKILDDAVNSWILNGKLVSAELLITEEGKPAFHKAYGDTEINSIWQIKSMTKPITATAALLLVQEGKLSLEDPVSKFIPEFAGDERTKVKNLLNHTSGYDYMITGWEGVDYDFNEWIKKVASEKPKKQFGKFQYSDFNIAALGYIVSLVSGQEVEKFTIERILNPLNMNDTYTWFTPDSSWAARVNNRYRWDPETRTNKLYWSHKEEHQWPFYKAAGGIYSTATDYAKFMQSWLDKGPLLNERIIEDQLLIPCKNGYGGGWAISGPVFYHGGYDGTYAFALPDNRVIILMAHSVGNTHKAEFRELLQYLD